MYIQTLSGCSPVPLAYYLKALGVLRLVAGSPSGDPTAKAAWVTDELRLSSRFNQEELVSFFLQDYQPTPVLAPWNGGSGFYKKDNREAIEALAASASPRLSPYRTGISAAMRAVDSLKLKEKPDGEMKEQLLHLCRNTLPDDALAWLDAVFVLSQDGPKYPPMLGTGGNDGRLEFTNNFMQRVTELINLGNGQPTAESERWLRAALFGSSAPRSTAKAPVGQFFPGAAGGANGTSGFDAPSAVNPWDFVLMIEGALLFAAASVKRLESADGGALVYPFCVRQAGVGYASAASADEKDARCEMWLPLWDKPTTFQELQATFGEGRAQVGGRSARSGVDFARAAVSLGVDRGITAFQRYGFQVRNGLAFFATPLSRIVVQRNASVDLLSDIDQWYDRLRQKAGSQANPAAPTSIARSLSDFESTVLDLCRAGTADSVQAAIISLGQTERALANSLEWTTKDTVRLRPLGGLRPKWLTDANTGSHEFHLAAALAGTRARPSHGRDFFWLRQMLEPLKEESLHGRWPAWDKPPSNDVVWHDGNLIDTLNDMFARRIIRFEKSGVKGWPDWSPWYARLDDITAFIEGRTDDTLIADLLWGLCLIDWQNSEIRDAEPSVPNRIRYDWRKDDDHRAVPSSFYALLKLCFQPKRNDRTIPLVPAIHNRARSGQGEEASILAARRLRASGCPPLVDKLPVSAAVARRTAAALLFPISPRDLSLLEQIIINQPEIQNA
jgi:CRISPR-associated protein Csx17